VCSAYASILVTQHDFEGFHPVGDTLHTWEQNFQRPLAMKLRHSPKHIRGSRMLQSYCFTMLSLVGLGLHVLLQDEKVCLFVVIHHAFELESVPTALPWKHWSFTSLFSIFFLLNYVLSNSPELIPIGYKLRESYSSMSMNYKSTRLKKWNSD